MDHVSTIRQRTSPFTALPRHLFDALITGGFTQRELRVLLLVARLTYGCRANRWALLRQADLACVGIGANHAKESLQALVRSGVLVKNGGALEYRIDAQAARLRDARALVRQKQVSQLVGVQLSRPQVPSSGSHLFRKREVKSSLKGNHQPLSS